MANTNNILDFQDPGALSEELLDMPGFVNELTDYTLTQAHSPNRTLAFLGATAMMAHLAGRTYADTHGTRTNLYLIALGETGIGKDAPRKANGKLADAVGDTHALCDAVASGEALEELVAKHPAILYQPDEAESFIGSLSGSGRNAMGLSERIRRLYSASSGLYAVRGTARSPEGSVVPYPHLTLFGTGTPQAFYDALDARSIANGLFGRCLVVDVPDAYKANHPTEVPLPTTLVDVARWHATNEKGVAESGCLNLITVEESPEAKCAFRSSADTLMILRKRLADSELFTARALVVRMNEKIAKLAMIRAISENPEKPVITGEGVRWAAQFVTHVTKAMLHEAQFHVAEGKFDALVKRFLGLLAKHGGSLDRRSLLRGLHVDHLTFRRIVMTLHMSDEIVEESECGKNVVYTIKDAA